MSEIAGIEALLARVAPHHTHHIDVELGGSGFSYHAAEDRLRLRGTDQIAIAAAFHHYCSEHLGLRFTWQRRRLDLPDTFTDAYDEKGATELVHRYYLNFVTYGYTMAFWDWQRWEQEIDWMALHSINRPLMTIGHEAILVETYLAMGLSEAAALEWIGSAAHFPWMFMGGVNSWGGPVSRDYLDQRIALARKVLARMRELGMRPVLPGFGGQVPTALADETASRIEWQGWHTPFLDPGSERYRQIATTFYRIQREHLGTDHLYAVDPFIESIPPQEDPEWLRTAGAGIYRALSDGDLEAVWVLQAWPFHYHKKFWTHPRALAFIDAVPRDKILLLDLWAEFAPLWRETEGMFGRPWLWCAVHNYGGRFALFGDLTGTVDGLREARRSPERGQLTGLGFAMEAIENNEVYYELLTDQVWSSTPLDQWLEQWARSRYRTSDPRAVEVWQILAQTLYAAGRARSTPSPIIARPWNDDAPFATQRLAGEALDDITPQHISANIDAENDAAVFEALPRLITAVELLLELPAGEERDRDVQEVLIHVVAQHARYAIRHLLTGYRRGDVKAMTASAADLYEHIEWLEQLAATQEFSMVGTWIEAARSWAGTAEEADRFEFDARSLVTVWGTQDSGLHDYSGRHWAGLLRDFYLPRWRMWAEWLTGGATDVDAFRRAVIEHEEGWRAGKGTYPSRPTRTITEVAPQVLTWLAASDMESTSQKERDNESTTT